MSTVKTVAGGTAFVGTFGTAGYGINCLINKDEGRIDIKFLYDEFQEGTVGKKIEDSKFLVIHNQYNTEEWEKVIKNNYGEGKKTIEEMQQECKGLLEAAYDSNDNNAKYKEAVKKCTKKITFKERMEKLSITFLENYETTTERRNKTEEDERWKKIKDTFQNGIIDKSSVEITSTDNSQKWEEYCRKEANMSWEKVKANKNFEEEWAAFVKGCSKTQPTNTPNYWTIS